MTRALAVLALLCVTHCAFAEYPLGPFSRPAKFPEGVLWNGHCGAQVERGFKLLALVPEAQANGDVGRQEFAGFLTLEVGGKEMFLEFAESGDGTETLECDQVHATVAKVSGASRQVLEAWQGNPFVWQWAECPEAPAEGVTWLLMGYGWAEKSAPAEVTLQRAGEAAPETVTVAAGAPPLLQGEKLGSPLVLLRNPKESFQLALVFTASPTLLEAKGDGLRV